MFFLLWIGNRFQECLKAKNAANVFRWTDELSRNA
jgi:hypothetical protein